MPEHNAPVVSILVLTEDSSKHAHATMEALCKKMLRLVEPDCQTHRIHCDPPNEQARVVVNANRWKNKKHRHLVDLIKTIATKICENKSFVLFHVDGDCAWSERDSSGTPRLFEEQVADRVRKALRSHDIRMAPATDDEAERLLGRLRLIMPYYSIEAWLYQNVDVAIPLCRTYHGGKDVERFEQWREKRHELDELHKPKESVCLSSKYNKKLAESAFPARTVYEIKASFAAAVDALLECTELRTALRETCS